MGKTVESYRMALEEEISTWKGFARALRIDDKVAFEALMDACRNHASAASNATRPIVFEPMMMCIALSQQKEVEKLKRQIDALKSQLEAINKQPKQG
jgi:hypothetical protein